VALNQEALSFFAHGRQIRTYRIGELIDSLDHAPKTNAFLLWQREGGVIGDFEYLLTTADGNRFVFDIRTGEIVSDSRAGRISRRTWLTTLGLVAVGVTLWLVHRWRSETLARGGFPD
jgi:hypothetical protein